MATYHVLPINDTKEHSEVMIYTKQNEHKSFCKCGATVQLQDNGNLVVIHNSFDGREGLELANEILNKLK